MGKSQILFLILVGAVALLPVKAAADDELASPSPALTVALYSSSSPAKLTVYGAPESDDPTERSKIIAAPPSIGGGISKMIMVKPDPQKDTAFSFFATTISPKEGASLHVLKLQVSNNSEEDASFAVGDVAFQRDDGEAVAFFAVGRGSSPAFIKRSGVEYESASTVTIDVPQDEEVILTFVFIEKTGELPTRFALWNNIPPRETDE